MNNPASNVRNRQKTWIDQISSATGHSYSRIAKEAGLAQSTVSRFMDDAQSSGALTARTEEKIRVRYGRDKTSYVEEDTHNANSIAIPKKSYLDNSYGMVDVPEYNVQISAGGGTAVLDEENEEHIWTIPKQTLLALAPDPHTLRIITVKGDSMEPDYKPGEKVLVDVAHTVYTHDGVYALDFGFGLILKQLQLVIGSKPIAVDVISKNATYPTQRVKLEDVVIKGRIVAKWVPK